MEELLSCDEIKALYDSGKTNEVIDACVKLINAGQASAHCYMYMAATLLNAATGIVPNDEVQDYYCSLIASAYKATESSEEYFEVENFLETEYNKWEYSTKKLTLCSVKLHSDFLKILITQGALNKFSTKISSNIGDATYAHIAEKEGSEFNEAKLKYRKPAKEYKSAYYRASYRYACNVFDETIQYFESNMNKSPQYLASIVGDIISKFTLATELIDHALPEAEEIEKGVITKKEAAEWLKKKAEIICYQLDACFHPNGGTLSLYTNSKTRSDFLNDVTKIYEEVKRYEPGFSIPELPALAAVEAPATAPSSNTGSSGGCYVATAVYGSYNCPQVWTLRRYRDYTLAESIPGRMFIRVYYAVSPTLVKWFGETKWFRNMWKPGLDKMVQRLNEQGVEDTPYEDKSW